MGKNSEPLYDADTMTLMSEAFSAAAKKVGDADKAAQVAMAVAIIGAINGGQTDRERLVAIAVAAARSEKAGAE